MVARFPSAPRSFPSLPRASQSFPERSRASQSFPERSRASQSFPERPRMVAVVAVVVAVVVCIWNLQRRHLENDVIVRALQSNVSRTFTIVRVLLHDIPRASIIV